MEEVSKDMIDALRFIIDEIRDVFAEVHQVGGSYVSPANRIMLLALAQMLEAKDILETGTNTGLTTMALALSGAQVVGVDNNCEDPATAAIAHARLVHFPNVRLVQEDALLFLVRTSSESYDLVFIDDCHWPSYTSQECVEIQRILRPGGCAVFHDTFHAELWEVIQSTFPIDWQRINLPSRQDWPGYSGVQTMAGRDLGLGVVRKPWVHIPASKSIQDCMARSQGSDGRLRPSLHTEIRTALESEPISVYDDEHNTTVVGIYTTLLQQRVPILPLSQQMTEGMEGMIRSWGKYASACASFVGQERYGHRPPPPKVRKQRIRTQKKSEEKRNHT